MKFGEFINSIKECEEIKSMYIVVHENGAEMFAGDIEDLTEISSYFNEAKDYPIFAVYFINHTHTMEIDID